jgi:CRP-like cAMP-binding protein
MGTSQPSIEKDLRDLTFAAEWPDGTIAEIANLTARTACPAGAVIFREGEQSESIHFVVSGLVALEMSVPARGTVRLLTLGNGELLGWSPLVGNPEMTATAVAIEPTNLLTIPSAALLALCDRNHEIGFAVMRRLARALSRRLTATRLQLLDLFSNSTPEFIDAAAGKA